MKNILFFLQASQNEHLQATSEKSKEKDKKITTAVALAAKVLDVYRVINFTSLGLSLYF